MNQSRLDCDALRFIFSCNAAKDESSDRLHKVAVLMAYFASESAIATCRCCQCSQCSHPFPIQSRTAQTAINLVKVEGMGDAQARVRRSYDAIQDDAFSMAAKQSCL